jgi:hypothetical protein
MGDTINVNNSGTTKVEMLGMDNQKMTISVPDVVKSENKTILSVPDVVKSETKTTLSIPDTVKSEARNDLNLDIRPMVTDTCLTLKTAPFPETLIRQPYTFHFGLTLYGTEIMAMDFSGESQVIIENLPKKPAVAWGGEQAIEHGSPEPHGHHQGGESGGLRIRLGP